MAKALNRQRKTLVCTECNEENYRVEKNIKNTIARIIKNSILFLLFIHY